MLCSWLLGQPSSSMMMAGIYIGFSDYSWPGMAENANLRLSPLRLLIPGSLIVLTPVFIFPETGFSDTIGA